MDPLFDVAGLGSLRPDYAALDWSATALGAPQTWSPTLRATVALVLRTRFAVTLFWGAEFTMVYNEAYAQMIGSKHPSALGRPAHEVFPEVWPQIGPVMTAARDEGRASWTRDERLLLDRHGFAEETYFTFSYSPVPGPGGDIEGVVDIATETTREVVDRRRLTLIAALQAALVGQDESVQVLDAARAALEPAAEFAAIELTTGDDAGPAADPGPVRIRRGDTDGQPVLHVDGMASLVGGVTMTVEPGPHLAVDDGYLEFVRVVATTVGQALDRAVARGLERQTATSHRELSESLQRGLLTQSAHPHGLSVSARYHAAASPAQIGGDWHDAFVLPDGTASFVVGDVGGHDHHAAAIMAQLRNLLRGIAITGGEPPAAVLRGLDAALRTLDIETFATALVMQVSERGAGRHRLRWSSAGHLPGILLLPDRRAYVLESPAGLPLGVEPGRARYDRELLVDAGSLLVLYTDGLIERRDTDLGERIEALRSEIERHAGASPGALSDQLLATFGRDAQDDVVVLVVRFDDQHDTDR